MGFAQRKERDGILETYAGIQGVSLTENVSELSFPNVPSRHRIVCENLTRGKYTISKSIHVKSMSVICRSLT